MTFTGNYFAPNDGYEHDFRLNNYSEISLPGTYMLTALSGTGFFAIPKVEEWRTSWPASSRPYLDNRFLDGKPIVPYEVAYSIGMVYANQIRANVEYYTYIRVKRGNADRDSAKLWAVKLAGKTRTVTNPGTGRCGNQWCMFEYQNRKIYPA